MKPPGDSPICTKLSDNYLHADSYRDGFCTELSVQVLHHMLGMNFDVFHVYFNVFLYFRACKCCTDNFCKIVIRHIFACKNVSDNYLHRGAKSPRGIFGFPQLRHSYMIVFCMQEAIGQLFAHSCK